MAAPSIEEILAPLDAYYASIPLEFSIGLQNFQSIRQYTKIPLAPITLIYGQNSAGKSAIHDAFNFIYDFLKQGEWPARNYLDRWASRQRINRPLTKGYLGQPEDVVVSIQAWGFYWNPLGNGINSLYPGTGKTDIRLSQLCEYGLEPTRFSLRFHFSDASDTDEFSDWFIREFHFTVGSDKFIRYQSQKTGFDNYDSAFSINKTHILFHVLGNLCDKPLDEIAKDCEFCNGETQADNGDWLTFKELRMNMGGHDLEWISDRIPFPRKDYHILEDDIREAIEFRALIEGLLKFASERAFKFTDIHTVPPLRPVPTKEESYFRIDRGYAKDSDSPWKKLAYDIKTKDFYRLWSRLKPNSPRLEYIAEEEGSLLPYVNHMLQHPLFLDTGYEIIGECRYLISADLLAEIQDDDTEKDDNWAYFRQELHTDVKLKLRSIPDKYYVEIEDVGVGISQIIPVLCAVQEHSRAYIHQPELHLHPKHQSHLGDIFIGRINANGDDDIGEDMGKRIDSCIKAIRDPASGGGFRKFFIIETHSEHILLRMLRRIRETNQSEIYNKLFGFTSDQLCVLYVDKDENGDGQVMQLRVAQNGEFIDRWPHGFFTERDEDLFDE